MIYYPVILIFTNPKLSRKNALSFEVKRLDV